jgi:hypothetical protein
VPKSDFGGLPSSRLLATLAVEGLKKILFLILILFSSVKTQ